MHQRSSTRIIWNLSARQLLNSKVGCCLIGAGDKPEVNKPPFIQWPHGLCIESSQRHKKETLSYLHKMRTYFASLQSPMPALMLSFRKTPKGHVLSESQDVTTGQTIMIYASNQTRQHSQHSRQHSQHSRQHNKPQNNSPLCPSVVVSMQDFASVRCGDELYFGYGDCVVKALEVKEKSLLAEVVSQGTIHTEASFVVDVSDETTENLLEQHISAGELKQVGVNYLMLPGSLSPKTVKTLRRHLRRDDETSPWLIFRIDSKQAIKRFRAVEEDVDGVMISRRDLALTENPDMLPILTKELIARCRYKAKLAIVASHMLGSMRQQVTPTRAEVSDIAYAVFDGADAITLPEKTLIGPYGTTATEVASRVIEDVTSNRSTLHHHHNKLRDVDPSDMEMDVICIEAAKTALHINAKALVCITKTGNTALRLSSIDIGLPIIAITFHETISRKLQLLRGVESLVLKSNPGVDKILPRINELIKAMGWLKKGDKIVFVTVTLSSMSDEASNLFTVQNIY
ncbi:MAG: pyruvate kinase [Proteobacteria bacterium]|nr:pyruvate kinase [Pseudomonadota bacterium]